MHNTIAGGVLFYSKRTLSNFPNHANAFDKAKTVIRLRAQINAKRINAFDMINKKTVMCMHDRHLIGDHFQKKKKSDLEESARAAQSVLNQTLACQDDQSDCFLDLLTEYVTCIC